MYELIQVMMQISAQFHEAWVQPMHEVAMLLYSTLFFPMVFFSSLFYIMTVTGCFSKMSVQKDFRITRWPRVTIQIPTRNEIAALRCAKKCLEFDYPKDRYEVIIGDDSDNPNVSKVIREFASGYPGRVKVTKRESNVGFKAGNLNNMLKYSTGDIIVVFDSDFTPTRKFLKRVVPPFVMDKKVGFVQTKWKHENMDQNIVTRFASSVLMVYQNLLAYVNSRLGVPLLFGSAEAVRKDLLVRTGGWKEGSLTEDVEFSLRALKKGYKSVYLSDFRTPGEVPFTVKGFFKQQKRWAYGNARVFMDYWRWILSSKRLNFFQRSTLTMTLVGYIASPFLVTFMVFGTLSFMSGKPSEIDFIKFVNSTGWAFFINSGFIAALVAALTREKRIRMFFHVLFGAFTVGLYTAFGVTSGFFRAILGMKMDWYMIKKLGNKSANPSLRPSAS
jgi:cellulose synthase/poly-beta-1,6-N-acetylglucosamine synthase-like glycosyltransferase